VESSDPFAGCRFSDGPAGVQRVPAATSETQKGSVGGAVPVTAAGLPSVSNCELTTTSRSR